MKQQINEVKRMQQLAGVKQLNENINSINQVEKILKELVEDYIGDTVDTAGEELDFGGGVVGYNDKKQLIQDFIDYISNID